MESPPNVERRPSGLDQCLTEAIELLHGLERLAEQRRKIFQDHARDALFPFAVEVDLLVEPALQPRWIGEPALHGVAREELLVDMQVRRMQGLARAAGARHQHADLRIFAMAGLYLGLRVRS